MMASFISFCVPVTFVLRQQAIAARRNCQLKRHVRKEALDDGRLSHIANIFNGISETIYWNSQIVKRRNPTLHFNLKSFRVERQNCQVETLMCS